MNKVKIKAKELHLKEKRLQHRNQQIKHAIGRAKERYNLDLTEEDIKEIGRIICNNKFIREDFTLLTNPNRRIQLKYKDETMWVAYCMKTNCVSTFLPKDDTRLTFSNFKNNIMGRGTA